MPINSRKLAEMEALDIKEADISKLTDLRDIKADINASVEEKLASFAEQTSNLYVSRIGNYIIKVSYQKQGPSANDKIQEYIRRMSEIYL